MIIQWRTYSEDQSADHGTPLLEDAGDLSVSMIEDETGAIAKAMEQLPTGTQPLETEVRLVRPASLEAVVPGLISLGWSSDTPMWAVLVMTNGLVGDDLIHVPAPADDDSSVLGAIYVWDANSGFTVAAKPIRDMELYNDFLQIQSETLTIAAATIGPQPTDEPEPTSTP